MISLTNKDFERILRKFADDPDDVLVERETIICKINGEDIHVELSENEDGILFCKEADGALQKAKLWIEKRLAKLDELASKIQQYVPLDEHFIPVGSQFDCDGNLQQVQKTTDAIYDIITSKNSYATDAVYLLSEAGDGKTMIMDRVAAITAKKYKEGAIHSLFLPVSLQGRPFLRIDDLVIGILAHKYRFRKYYFDAIIELVKLNMLVLGLDGFEEMVVEGKEDNVISSLGELLSQMDSNGKLVISARRAFYDYALKNQAPLVESIRDLQVDFPSFRLAAWSKNEFYSLLNSFNFDGHIQDEIYSALVARLGNDHPILTRPVLARKLVEMLAETGENWRSIINNFDADKNPQAVIEQFVTMLLKREATEKWLALSGPSIARQLLKTEQHFELLQILAEEMWLSNVEFVKQDYLQAWIEIFCEQQKLSPAETKDCQEKIIHHAMLFKDGDKFLFCHEAFRQYFLGKQIASYMVNKKIDFQLTKILSQDIIPIPTIDEIAYELNKNHMNFSAIAAQLCKLKGGISKISPISQNIGGLLLAFWKRTDSITQYEFSDLFFAESSLKACTIKNLNFSDCIIEKIDGSLKDNIVNVKFANCSITTLLVDQYNKHTIDCTFDIASLPKHIHIKEADEDEYNPEQIKTIISSCGGHILDVDTKTLSPIQRPDESLAVFCRIVKIFYRTSGVSGNILALKFGEKWNTYKKEFLPIYVEKRLLELTNWQGKGSDDRYKLGISIDKFEFAHKNCNGSFDKFVELSR